MKLRASELKELIREQVMFVVSSVPEDYESPDSTDAWHPSEIVPREDAWSGGENIDTPLDHTRFETGESNAGPHVSLGFSGKPDSLGDEEDTSEFSPGGDLLSFLSLFLEEDLPGEEVANFSPGHDGLLEPESKDQSIDDEEVEREDIALRIIGDMEEAGLTGESGLFRYIDDVDEFEDLIRFIFQDVKLDNRQLAGVAMSIAKDFLDDPEDAHKMSNFNL